MTNFTRDWKPLPFGVKYCPVITPCYKWTVGKGSKNFDNYCRTILLSEKPGRYPSNVGSKGTIFESHEDELIDFMNSPFCPELIKYDYKRCVLYSNRL